MSFKRKKYIFLVVWLVLFVVLLITGPFSLVDDLKQASSNLVFQKKALKLFDFQVANFKSFQENRSFYQSVLKETKASFIKKDAPIKFINFLEEEGEKNNLSVQVSSEGVSKKKGNMTRVDFSLITSGAFKDCLRYLDRLENAPWVMKISNVEVESIEGEGRDGIKLGEGKTALRIDIRAFSWNF